MQGLQLNVDHDYNPRFDDIVVPNGQEKNKFFLQSNKVIPNNDGRNVASAKKFNTYYPKILSLNKLSIFYFYLIVECKIKDENKQF